MIDILNVQEVDIIVYGKYPAGSIANPEGSLGDKRYLGIYQDFTFRSLDGGPIRLCIHLIGQDGSCKAIYSSQVINAFRGATC